MRVAPRMRQRDTVKIACVLRVTSLLILPRRSSQRKSAAKGSGSHGAHVRASKGTVSEGRAGNASEQARARLIAFTKARAREQARGRAREQARARDRGLEPWWG